MEIYAAFPDIFVNPMTMAVKKCLTARGAPADWLISLQRNIPTSQSADIVDQMRPMALQAVLWKGIATTMLVVVEDALQLAIPPAQKGFPKHGQMLHHVINTRGLWESTEEGTFLSVDFAKAYDSVSHVFFEAVMQYRDDITGLLVQSLSGEVQLCIDNGVAPNVSMAPQSGIRQGDPPSPPIFALSTVFLIYHFKDQCPVAVLMLYADDLLIWISGGNAAAERQAQSAMRVLQEFGAFSGLKVNMQKSFAILKRQSCPAPERYVGLTVKDKVRCLGVQIGHVNAEQAYAAPMAKMKARVAFLKTLPLEVQEKAEIFRIWIQPVVQLTEKHLRAFTESIVCIKCNLQNGTGAIFMGPGPNNDGGAS